MKSPSEKTVEIINWAMNVKGLKQIEIEDRALIPRGTIGKWRLNGSQNITANNLGKILLAFPQINTDWVMRDCGEMLSEVVESKVAEPEKPSVVEYDIEFVNSLIDENKLLKKKLESAQKAINAMLS